MTPPEVHPRAPASDEEEHCRLSVLGFAQGSNMARGSVSAPPHEKEAQPRRRPVDVKEEKLDALREELDRDAFVEMHPFGKIITASLKDARRAEDGGAIWEEEDYCSPPLAMEREAVLDTEVECGEGWRRIDSLASLL